MPRIGLCMGLDQTCRIASIHMSLSYIYISNSSCHVQYQLAPEAGTFGNVTSFMKFYPPKCAPGPHNDLFRKNVKAFSFCLAFILGIVMLVLIVSFCWFKLFYPSVCCNISFIAFGFWSIVLAVSPFVNYFMNILSAFTFSEKLY